MRLIARLLLPVILATSLQAGPLVEMSQSLHKFAWLSASFNSAALIAKTLDFERKSLNNAGSAAAMMVPTVTAFVLHKTEFLGPLLPIVSAAGVTGQLALALETELEPYTEKDWVPPAISSAVMAALILGYVTVMGPTGIDTLPKLLPFAAVGTSVYRAREALACFTKSHVPAPVSSLSTAITLYLAADVMNQIPEYSAYGAEINNFQNKAQEAAGLTIAGLAGGPSITAAITRLAFAYSVTNIFGPGQFRNGALIFFTVVDLPHLLGLI